MKILILIPAYNEAGGIARCARDLRSAVPEADLLCVNDGSTDNTAPALKAEGIPFVSHPFNLGIGAAVKTGMRYAETRGYDAVVRVDGDGQHPAEEVRKVLAPLEQGLCDMAVGSRYLSNGEGFQSGRVRRAGSRFYRVFLKALVGQAVTDPTSGFFAANRRTIRALSRFYPRDFPEIESLVLLLRAGFRVREVAVRMAPRGWGRSSITPPSAFIYMVTVPLALLLEPLKKNPYAGILRG